MQNRRRSLVCLGKTEVLAAPVTVCALKGKRKVEGSMNEDLNKGWIMRTLYVLFKKFQIFSCRQ